MCWVQGLGFDGPHPKQSLEHGSCKLFNPLQICMSCVAEAMLTMASNIDLQATLFRM